MAKKAAEPAKQNNIGKKKDKKKSKRAPDMAQLLKLNKQLDQLGGSHIALQAIQLVEKFIAEYGSIEDARIAIERLEKLKAELK
jgi:hypothetical protein